MQERLRFYTSGHGTDDRAMKRIIDAALEIEKDTGLSRIVFIANGLTNTGWLERQYGREGVKKLIAGAKLPNSNLTAKFESLKTYRSKENELVITLGLRSDDLLLIEDNYNITAIIGFPWLPNDIEKWTKITNAICIENHSAATPYPKPDCIVRVALEHLSQTINMSTGITHPMDNNLAKTYLRSLAKFGYDLNAINIEAYLFNELGWEKENLDEFIDIINKINDGKSFQGGDKTGLKDNINRWKEECK
jgi:hypothetical protein